MRKAKIVPEEAATSRANKSPNRRKEGETNMVTSTPNHYQLLTRQSHADNGQRGGNNLTRAFASVPMSHAKLLAHLVQNGLIVPFPLKPLQLPYTKNYDLNVKCDYHVDIIGHTTKKCLGLKHMVQDLMNVGLLSFEEKGPNAGSNPLPNHEGTSISNNDVVIQN
ncbi:hypothetical protein CR513_41673, partial [Mucuna pruriens]